ncbi:MAG: amidase [Acidobacteriota bacterium]
MRRREFLRYGVVGGALALARPRVARAIAKQTGMDFSQATSSFELEEVTVAALQEGMSTGRLTARAIAESYLARIEELDRGGPGLNSVLEINPDALAIADSLDEERRARGPRGPLHGIPVMIKDNIDTADRMTTTAGSLALEGSIAPADSFVARQLRQAGAVILAKTNLSEWANFRSNHSSSGWSGRGGQTHNPYALDRNPCGSSSGSGAAVSANFCAIAIGTETDGSVVCPSSANGVVGIKPTVGLVGRSGIVPIAHSQDSAGPMARTVRDAAILLGALTGVDPRDPATDASRGRSHSDYTRFLDPDGLSGARIGVARNFFGFHDRVDTLMDASIETMSRLGAEIVDPANMETAGKFDDSEFEVLLYEFKADLNKYLAGRGPDVPVRSLQAIIDFNERNRDREMPYFGQEIMLMAEEKGPLSEQKYVNALAANHRLARDEGIDALIRQHRLDAIVAPTEGPPWTTDLVNGDHFSGGSSSPAAVAGYPDITVPAGYVWGLPVGISFFGAAYSEPTLLKLAYAFEQATKVRRAPRFLSTADLSV